MAEFLARARSLCPLPARASTLRAAGAMLSRTPMADPRLAVILDRMSAALDRLEARPTPDPSLPERHRKLRAAMGEAIAGLDRLIEVETR